MPMFHWNTSDVFGRYASGDIIVEAPGLPEARRKVLAHFDAMTQEEEHSFWWLDPEELAEKRAELKRELETKKPLEDVEVIIIWGSE